MSIKIIADTSCDLPQHYVEKLGIGLVPFKVSFDDGETFLERFEITSEKFSSKMLNSKALPKTAAPDPGTLMVAFEKGLSSADQIIFFSISSALSSGYQNAHLAAGMLKTERITIYDGLSISLGTGILIIKTAEMIRQGLAMEEISMRLNELRKNTEMFMMVDSLENLVKGGRLGKYEGMAGSFLNIKPIIRMSDNGVPEIFEKVRGKRKALNRLIDLIGERAGDNVSQRIIGISHLDCIEDAQEMAGLIKERYQPEYEIIISGIGSTLGTHGGPGSIFIAF
ncbi:MAG: DegV family protein [Syntrophomonadaceae bacterium]